MMTKDEAKTRQKWAGMDGSKAFHLIERGADDWEEIGMMMNAWLEANQNTNLDLNDDLPIAYLDGYANGRRSKSSIAQAICDTAVNWPQFLGDVECGILDAFSDWCQWQDSMLYGNAAQKIQCRTFMPLAAEALES